MSSDNKSEIIAKVADAPFNDVKRSDVIFRTADGVDFYVHRIVLILASPFFEDMFALPQPPPSEQSKPFIDVSESSTTLNLLLRICYPVDDPEFPNEESETLTLIGDSLEAALKYQIAVATKIMKGHLRRVGDKHPLHLYAIACRLQLEDEAFLAAQRWRDSRLNVIFNSDGKIFGKGQYIEWEATISGACYSHEMAKISAGAYYRLAQFIRTGVRTTFCSPPPRDSEDSTSATQENILAENYEACVVSKHFNFPDSDITVLSSDNVEFRVHELILRLSSTTILKDVTFNTEGKKYLKLTEDSNTLTKMFQLRYPGTVDDDITDDVCLSVSALLAAAKYKIQKVVKALKDYLLCDKLHSDPLRIYLAFVRCGLMEESLTVARNALPAIRVESLYIPEMEGISADVLHQMLRIRHVAISVIVRTFAMYEGEDCDTDWWHVASPFGDVSNHPKDISIATPIVLRHLKRLQEECRRYFVNHYMYSSRSKAPRIPPPDDSAIAKTGTFNLKQLFDESARLYQEVDLELKLVGV